MVVLFSYMALVDLSVISIFKCKYHYRSCVLRQIIKKMMNGNYSKLSLFWVSFMFVVHLCKLIPHTVNLQIASLVKSMPKRYGCW